MLYVAILYCVSANAGPPDLASPLDVLKAVVSNREQVRTLQVRAVSTRTWPKARTVTKDLFLDVDAQRWRVDTTGLAPNAIYFGCFEDFKRFRHAFCAPALARDLLAHFGFLGTAKMEHGWHDLTTTFNEE